MFFSHRRVAVSVAYSVGGIFLWKKNNMVADARHSRWCHVHCSMYIYTGSRRCSAIIVATLRSTDVAIRHTAFFVAFLGHRAQRHNSWFRAKPKREFCSERAAVVDGRMAANIRRRVRVLYNY